MARVLAIGLDSGTGAVLDDLARDGALPNLAAMRPQAARYELDSGPGHRHGMLWPQFITGVEAQFGGEWLRLTFDPATYEPYQEAAHHEIGGVGPFWERAGVDTVAFDVPRVTCGGPGVQVTSWGGHAPLYPRASNPSGLLDEIDRRFGPHPAFGNDYGAGWHDESRLDVLTDALEVGARRRGDIARHLQERFPSELFVTVMSETHSLSEFAWHGIDEHHPLFRERGAHARALMHRMLRAVDDAIGSIAAAARDDTVVMVFSLDGMKSSHGDLPSIVLLPELLHRAQFGSPLVRDPDQRAWRAAGFPPLVARAGRPWRPDLDERLVEPAAAAGLRSRLHKIPGFDALRNSRAARAALARARRMHDGALGLPIPKELREGAAEAETFRESTARMLFLGHYQPYWHRMPAFVLPSFGDGYVRVNLAGRERDGIVERDDYERVLTDVEAMVATCRNPRTGRSVALDIERVEGDPVHSDRYADLIIRWVEPTDAFEHPEVGTIGPFPLHRTGTHADGGFAWITGDGIPPGARGRRSVLDLPPTVLALLDRRAPQPLSGRALMAPSGAPQPA
jgi:predicted AlkP superfamily phosphohydrolase/phosphomutase